MPPLSVLKNDLPLGSIEERHRRPKANFLQTTPDPSHQRIVFRNIEDASSFVKANPSNPKLIGFIEKINDLDAALIQGDPSKLKYLMEDLSGALRHEPGYEVLEVDRNIKRQEEAARYLPVLIKTAQQQPFIRNYIMNNPTPRPTASFIPLIKEPDSNLTKPDLSQLKTLTSQSRCFNTRG